MLHLKNSVKPIAIALLLALTTLSSCVNTNEGVDLTSETAGSVAVTDSIFETETEMKEIEYDIRTSLGLCVTDLLYSGNTTAKCRFNYRRFREAGIKTIRLIPSWSSTGKGEYRLNPAHEEQLRAAVAENMRIKLVISTVDEPPAWVYNDEGAKFVSESGTVSLQNCVSYWYKGLAEYVEDAVSCKLDYLNRRGYLDSVDAVVVSFGAACEPIYPADWTQNGISEMWCYGENAKEDFRRVMREKYKTVSALNVAWGTEISSFDDLEVPKAGEKSGLAWEDVLTWYRDVKREFVRHQVEIYKRAVENYCGNRVKLILYMPGDAYTQADWNKAVSDSSLTSSGLKIMSENEYIVRVAGETGAYLQFTGLPMTSAVKKVMNYIFKEGYSDIPVYGENTNDASHASDPSAIVGVIRQLGLSGIDYTTSQFLFENNNYITPANTYKSLSESIPVLTEYLMTKNGETPYILRADEAKPAGDVIEYKLTSNGFSVIETRLFAGSYDVKPGDVIEYDVFIPEGITGVGQLDASFTNKKSAFENLWVNDERGLPCSETDLSDVSGKWVHRKIYIGTYEAFVPSMNTVGTKLSDISVFSRTDQCNVTVFFDNIIITNEGKEKLVVFRDAKDLKAVLVKNDISGDAFAEICTAQYKG